MPIKLNPNWSEQEITDFLNELQANKNYCPCRLDRVDETKCPCEQFRNQKSGECYCGLFVKE